jgi:hypothetical protein
LIEDEERDRAPHFAVWHQRQPSIVQDYPGPLVPHGGHGMIFGAPPADSAIRCDSGQGSGFHPQSRPRPLAIWQQSPPSQWIPPQVRMARFGRMVRPEQKRSNFLPRLGLVSRAEVAAVPLSALP